MPALQYLSQFYSTFYLLFAVSLREKTASRENILSLPFVLLSPRMTPPPFQEKTLICNDVFFFFSNLEHIGLIKESLSQAESCFRRQ